MTKQSPKEETRVGTSKVAPRSSRQQRRIGQTRAKLLEAARAVFAEKGLDLVTVDDITERADLGKGTFYYHFKNKENLIRELIRQVMRELADAVLAEARSKHNLNDVLEGIITAHIQFFGDRWEDYVLYFQGRADLALAKGYDGIESPIVEYLKCIENAVDMAIKRKISPTTLRRIACAIAGFVAGYYSFALIDTKSEHIERTVRSMRGALVASLSEFVNEAVP